MVSWLVLAMEKNRSVTSIAPNTHRKRVRFRLTSNVNCWDSFRPLRWSAVYFLIQEVILVLNLLWNRKHRLSVCVAICTKLRLFRATSSLLLLMFLLSPSRCLTSNFTHKIAYSNKVPRWKDKWTHRVWRWQCIVKILVLSIVLLYILFNCIDRVPRLVTYVLGEDHIQIIVPGYQ